MPAPRYLVATDLSVASRAALAAATGLARRTGASVELFCAVPATLVDEQRALVGRVRDGLGKLAERASQDGVAATFELRVTRDVPRAIATRAEASAASLVAVGPSGVTGWKKFVLGSVTERMLRLAPSMLLVARGRAATPPVNILAAIDRTAGSLRAIRAAIGIARATGGKVTALHVVAPQGAALFGAGDVYLPETWSLEAERVALAQRDFGRWVAGLDPKGVELTARVVEGNPADVVVAEAKALGADLVVVGSHGKTAVHEFFVGSVARDVATHCAVSVLVVRAPRRGSAGRGPARRERGA